MTHMCRYVQFVDTCTCIVRIDPSEPHANALRNKPNAILLLHRIHV